MPYPNYINTRVIRFGGATGQASGSLLCTRVVIKSSRSLVHDASGYRFEADTISNVSAAGGEVEFLLPTTDQAGMRDANTNALIDVSAPNTYTHQYTATITFELASGKPANSNTYTVGPFAFPQGDSSVVDGDKFIVTSTTAGQQISIPDSWSSRLTALETQVGSIPTTGFGDAAGKSVGNAAGTVAAGDDARFGTIPNSYVTDAKIAPTAAINSDKLADGTTNKVYTATEKTKLAGIATGATANSTDAALRDRSTHTGTQTSVTISDLNEYVQDMMSTFLASGTGISLSYNDAGNLLTITNIGAADAEAIQDAMGAAMVGIGVVTVTYNDAANTITISSTATQNSTDAALRDRSTHTGTQSADTVIDGTTNKVYTATEKTKLAGIATGATVNDTDANLENRTNHSGTEPLTALPISLATDLYQNNAGVWPSASAIESTRRVIWIGYPGLATAPATTGRPNSVAGLDTYIVRP